MLDQGRCASMHRAEQSCYLRVQAAIKDRALKESRSNGHGYEELAWLTESP